MITIPALKVRQFGAEFYQVAFSAADVEKLVRFEVLGYERSGQQKSSRQQKSRRRAQVNWEALEKRIGESEAAFQRPVIRKKIEELVKYYASCKEVGTLPAIPGAVIMIAEKSLTFSPSGSNPHLGLLQIPEEAGILRALDGQHRLLALHAAPDHKFRELQVPAVLFDSLDARQIIELFVTINAKHTRLNPSHLISLAGRRLYTDANQALAHDIIRTLNGEEGSPLAGEIRILGVGRGSVSQASLAEEIVDLLESMEKLGGAARLKEFRGSARRFFLNYVKAIAAAFPVAWAGRKYSIKTGSALRAFIRVAPDVMAQAKGIGGEPFDAASLKKALVPWTERVGDRRFETEGEWRSKLAGGTRGTVEVLARELRDALRR